MPNPKRRNSEHSWGAAGSPVRTHRLTRLALTTAPGKCLSLRECHWRWRREDRPAEERIRHFVDRHPEQVFSLDPEIQIGRRISRSRPAPLSFAERNRSRGKEFERPQRQQPTERL